DILLKWQIHSFPKYERGTAWFVVAGIIGAALILYALLTANFLFAIIIFIFGLILALTSIRKPDLVDIMITETGIGMGRSFYQYRDIEHFSVIYDPPITQNLYIELRGGFRPHISIDLQNQNPVLVREILVTYVPEDRERTEEPFSEFLGRLLKI
ncbi:MAG: hypothetical protein Q8P82_00395, partial [bacterium]|nr:hypothetical protein [bacterium]